MTPEQTDELARAAEAEAEGERRHRERRLVTGHTRTIRGLTVTLWDHPTPVYSPGERTRLEQRRAQLRAFERSGRLPPFTPSWSWPKRTVFRSIPKGGALPPLDRWTGKMRPCDSDHVTDGGALPRYLEAMGFDDETQANPAAIYHSVYEALERGERCDVCGRRGEQLCRPCQEWRRGSSRRAGPRQRYAPVTKEEMAS